jgi:hypothetical protein
MIMLFYAIKTFFDPNRNSNLSEIEHFLPEQRTIIVCNMSEHEVSGYKAQGKEDAKVNSESNRKM